MVKRVTSTGGEVDVGQPVTTKTRHAVSLLTGLGTGRFNGYARQITLGLLDGPPDVRRDAHDLAVKVGLLT